MINATLDGVEYDYVATVYSDSILTTLINRALFVQPILPGLPSITHTDGTSRMTLSIGPDEVVHATSVYKCDPMDAAAAAAAAARPKVFLDVRSMAFPRRNKPPKPRCRAARTSAVSEAYVSPYLMQFRDHIMAPMEDLPVRQLATAVRTIATITPGGANTLFSY